MLALLAPPVLAQPAERAVGTKLADGQAYVTLVRLSHQPNPADNGRILIALEENGMEGTACGYHAWARRCGDRRAGTWRH